MASNLLLRVLLLQCLSFSIADQQHVLKGKINPLDAKFAKLALEKLEEWKVPGLAIGVVDGDDMWSEVTATYNFSLPYILTPNISSKTNFLSIYSKSSPHLVHCSHPLGLRHSNLPLHTGHTLNSLLRCQHQQSLHRRRYVSPRYLWKLH